MRLAVYSDLGGAAAAAGGADPVSAQRLAWGLAGPELPPPLVGGGVSPIAPMGAAPYNSFSHIARVLLGRWEMDDFDVDPQCGSRVRSDLRPGVTELNLLNGLADNGTRARISDLAPATPKEQIAQTLFEQAGLVIVDSPSTASSAISSALATQLIGIKAAAVAIAPATFATEPAGAALTSLVNSLGATDLAFGAQHNRVTFSIMTEGVTNVSTALLSSAAANSGLTLSTIANTALTPIGIAIQGGLSRALVATTDPIARSGPLMVGSQCPEDVGVDTLSNPGVSDGMAGILMDETVNAAPLLDTYPNVDTGPGTTSVQPASFPATYARQDVFAVGNAIRSRMVKLREQADTSAATTATTSVDAKARAGAVAELGAWAGAGRAILSADNSDLPETAAPANLYLDLVGIDPADFGVQTFSQIASVVSLVYAGPIAASTATAYAGPQLAECAAHLNGATCAQSLFTATWVPTASAQTTFGGTAPTQSVLRSRYGTTGTFARLTFPLSSAPNLLTRNSSLPGFGLDGTFYVVLAQDPTKPPGAGAILGALNLPVVVKSGATTLGEVSFALSPMRRELLKSAFGLGKWVGAAPPQVGDLPVVQTPSFCIDGVARDMFVPLQNDLSSDEDTYENSWRHYLSSAQTAADNADQLGQQLVDIGFQNDENIENAAQELLTLDGNPANVNAITVDADGKVSGGMTNPSLTGLLTQPTIDVVFFSKDPLNILPVGSPGQTLTAAQVTQLQSIMRCGSPAIPNSVCARLATSGVTVNAINPTDAASYAGSSNPLAVTYTALGLSPAVPPQTTENCAPLIASVAAMKGLSVPIQNAPLPVGAPPNTTPAIMLGPPVYHTTTAFDPGPFASALQAWGDDAQTTQTALSQIQMTVRADASWNVTFGGETIMESNQGYSWPGCLNPPSGTVPTCDWTNPVINGLNTLLRACPPGTDLQKTVLGNCDGGPIDNEINSLRWRVEGTLWTAAMMSGGVPKGMFTSPMPAANLVASGTSAPVSMYFVNGSFSIPGYPASLNAPATFANAPAAETNVLDSTVNASAIDPGTSSPTARWFHWNSSNVVNQLPGWLRNVYAPSSPVGGTSYTTGDNKTPGVAGNVPYVHLTGTNLAGASWYFFLNRFFTAYLNAGGVDSHDPGKLPAANPDDHFNMFQALAIANNLSGGRCVNPWDPTTGSPFVNTMFGPQWVQGLMASAKTLVSWGSPMLTPYDAYGEFNYRYFIWADSTSFLGIGPKAQGFYDYYDTQSLLAHALANTPPAQWFDQIPLAWNDCRNGTCSEELVKNGAPGVNVPPAPAAGSNTVTAPLLPYPYNNGSAAPASGVTAIGPNQRVQFALNSGAPNGDCDAAWQFTQALALGCMFSQDMRQNVTGQLTEPTTLNSLADLGALAAWVHTSVTTLALALEDAYVQNVPTGVIANALNTSGSLAGNGGTSGASLVQGANAVLDVYAKWNIVEKDAAELSDAMDGARNAIAIASTVEDMATINNSIQRLHTYKAMAEDVYQIAQGLASAMSPGQAVASGGVSFSAGPAQAAAGAIGLVTDTLTLPLIDQLDNDSHMLQAEQVQQALITLHQTALSDSADMSNALIAARQDANNVTAGAEDFATDKAKASYFAGKATGANVWQCSGASTAAPVECVSHVNTVLNRRYAGTELRYAAALRDAKALGYMARRAIEQRIGIRLSDITNRVGPLDPPATWADDVCHLTGVDYQSLTNTLGVQTGGPLVNGTNLSGVDQQVAGEFADAFIGDYMNKLSAFVQYYNVAYPEADGDDQTVLSLRESLLGAKPACLVTSPNLLTDSSRLFSATATFTAGWTSTPCGSGSTACLQVQAGSGPQPAGVGAGAISWLHDVSVGGAADGGADAASDAGDAGLPTQEGGAPSAAPNDVVFQAVGLNVAGTYILSWWDEARDPTTGLPSMAAVPYRAEVYNSTWDPVAGYTGSPSPSDSTGTQWSPRRVIQFTVANPDVYYVVFAATAAGGAPGSVGIADVQLELGTSSGAPSPFVAAGGGTQVTQFECPLSSSDLLASFQRGCDVNGRCYYDLQTPITINTNTMAANGVSLAGKLASGNYNFRHVDVAVNVVGTGVIDCSQTNSPDCQGSGYLAYTLGHDASNVGVLGFDGQYRRFDFGTATINNGKALTAERYLTNPLGSDDQQLVSQFLKPELRGRPIDGTYSLRIYDSPALRFDQIQDIQLIFKYHYWSAIQAPQNAN